MLLARIDRALERWLRVAGDSDEEDPPSDGEASRSGTPRRNRDPLQDTARRLEERVAGLYPQGVWRTDSGRKMAKDGADILHIWVLNDKISVRFWSKRGQPRELWIFSPLYLDANANQGEVAYGVFRHVQITDFVREMTAALQSRWGAWQAIWV
jgi:hypothetical protein